MADEAQEVCKNNLAIGLENLEFYHPSVNRHHAETMLMHNGVEGTYLLRRSSEHKGDYTLSVRYKDAVNHFPVTIHVGKAGPCIQFGHDDFENGLALAQHLTSSPLIAGRAGHPVVLRYGYPSHVPECATYDSIVLHAETSGLGLDKADASASDSDKPRVGENDQALHLEVGSKAGYLTKQGHIVKNWKVRWFVLSKNFLSYYKSRDNGKPIRTLDLSQCSAVNIDGTAEKPNCLALTFPDRTFYVCAQSPADADEWLRLLSFKLLK